jgi:epoxyqueuosine reductase
MIDRSSSSGIEGPEPGSVRRLLHRLAGEEGFDAAGLALVADLAREEEGERFLRWLAEGRHGTMEYMARDPGRRLDPSRVLPGARSVLCVALNYWEPAAEAPLPDGAGRVARYARGRDYHKTFTGRLKRLESRIREEIPGIGTRRYVDTGPVLEKLWAERAGLGWRGKHTNLLSREWGSWLLLGEILLDVEVEPDAPAEDHCGTCDRCLSACPTGAIHAPYRLDATLCISYLTIEHRGPIPTALRSRMGDHVFGCDDCLDACPWNRFARAGREADFRPRPQALAPLLAELVAMDEEGFRNRFAGTALMRARREGLARNACVALGNVGGEEAVEPLSRALEDDSALVREHAAWALARIRERLSSPRRGR